jgi:hypothetical protein
MESAGFVDSDLPQQAESQWRSMFRLQKCLINDHAVTSAEFRGWTRPVPDCLFMGNTSRLPKPARPACCKGRWACIHTQPDASVDHLCCISEPREEDTATLGRPAPSFRHHQADRDRIPLVIHCSKHGPRVWLAAKNTQRI